MQNRDRNRRRNPWYGAPPWAIEQGKLLYAIHAKLDDQSTRLSPEDQKTLDDLVARLKDTNAQIDEAKEG